MTEFIIVGRGLAASVIAHTLYQNNISFKIIGDQNLSNCSKAAAGIWNPVVFKRMTKSWLADELIPELNKFYTYCETLTNTKLITQRSIIKSFVEEQEEKLWFKKANDSMGSFLDTTIYQSNTPNLKACNIAKRYGLVNHSGNLNVAKFLKATDAFFKDHLINEVFNHDFLNITKEGVTYKNAIAKNIIFCEGYLVKNNPFFSWIPLKPAKGEIMEISAEDLELDERILNKNGFLMRIANGNYKVGATYQWTDLNDHTTHTGMAELKDKLNNMIICTYEVLNYQAGVRPSSIDRRPIIGKHPQHKNLYIFNGLGTKGVMLAPYFAKKFVNFYLQREELATEVDVKRFYPMYASKEK